MQESTFYVSHTGSRWREWTQAGSGSNNCSKFSCPVFSHPSPALQVSDNHVSHYKENAIIGVSILPHTFGIAQSLVISFSYFCLLNLLTTQNERNSSGITHTKQYRRTTCFHYSVVPKNLLVYGNFVRFYPKNVLFKD